MFNKDFTLKTMPYDPLPNSQIILGAASSKLPFTLTANLTEVNDTTDVQLTFEGEFNPMMEMMIKGPISKFIETLSQNIVKL